MYAFKSRVALILLIGLGSVWAEAIQPLTEQADKLPRVAVLCEHQDPELLHLAEQVEVLLAQRNDLAVLDRANIDKALREQGLTAKQGQDMETIVSIGKLLRTDLLVVAGKYEGFFAWRFVDVKNGVLAGLHVTRWPTEQRAAVVAEVEKAIGSTVNKIRDVPGEGKRYLSIVRFVNQDLSRQYDSLEEVLPLLLSAQLAAQPKIGLVERSRLSKVAEEKIGTEGVEGEYKAGTLIVKGEISILRSNATTSVSVALLAGKPNQPAHIRLTCVGLLGDLPSLARTMTEGLLKAMEVKPQEVAQADAFSEAGAFHLKGNFYMVHGDALSALSLYETACLLNSTNVVYREAYRGARRGVIGGGVLSQQLLLRYYIEDLDDWKSRFYSGGITPANVAQDEGWYSTGCIAMGEPKSEALAEQWHIAYDGYRNLMDLMFDYCKTNNIETSVNLRKQLIRNLLPGSFPDILRRMHRRDPKVCQNHEQAAFFRDPQDVSHYLAKYVDSEYPPVPRSGYRTLTPEMAAHYLMGFVSLHICSRDGIQPELDDYARAVFEHLLQNRNPFVRVWSKLILIQPGHEGKMYVIGGRSDVGQSIVNELAFWNLAYPPTDDNMSKLFLYLMHRNKRDIMPAVEAVRLALKEPGASYTKALDSLVQQIMGYHAEKMKVETSGQASETAMTPYHEWTDILCHYLNLRMRWGRKDEVIKKVKEISLAEKMSGSPEKAANCMAQITRDFKRYGYNYKDDVPCVTNTVPVIVQERKKEVIQYAKVVWHLSSEDIPNGWHYYFKSQVVLKDDKIFYYDYFNPYDPVGVPDTRRGYFDVTVIDLKTGRILQTPFYQESLRHRGDPELGLPKQEVRSWCEMDGRYYVGCVGGFGVFSDGVFTMLASCRKEDASQPLDGGAPYTVASIRPNALQKKLYLVIQGGAERNGVWEYTLETGAQKRLISIAGGVDDGIRDTSWDDTCLYVSGARYNLAFNTQSPDESFVVVQELKHHGFSEGKLVETYSHIKYWKEKGLRDVRGLDDSSPVSRAFKWIAQADLKQHVIYTAHTFETQWVNYLWKTGEMLPRRLILLDKQGHEVTSTEWMNTLSVAKWTATPHGFLYQLKGGGIGLFSDLDSFVDPASVATNKLPTINTSTLPRKGKTPPPVAQRIPVAWHLDDKQICKLDSIYADRTQLTITNDTLRYVSNVCFGGVRFIKSHAVAIDMKTGSILSSETSTNNLFVNRSEQDVSEQNAQRQRFGLQIYTPTHPAYVPITQSDGRHIIISFNEGILIADRHVPENTCWLMEKTNRQNPPATIPDVRWLGRSLSFRTIAASSRAIIFTPIHSDHTAFVWDRGKNEPREIMLVDKNGNEVSPLNYKAKEIYKWIALPQGFLYQLGDGSIGLVTDLEAKDALKTEEGK